LLFIDLYRLFPEFSGSPVDFCGSDSILDTLEKVRQVEPLIITNPELREYFLDAYHPSPRGYKIIAEIVAEQIKGKLWNQ